MTAKGKITTARLEPGVTRIQVREVGEDKFKESGTKIKNAITVTVIKAERKPAGTPYTIPMWDGSGTFTGRTRRSFFVLIARTDDGRELVNGYSTPSQTYWLA